MGIQLDQIIQELGGHLFGDANLIITGLASLKNATPTEISFVSNVKYNKELDASIAGCVIVNTQLEAIAKNRGSCIVTDQPYVYFARLTQLWKRHLNAESFLVSGKFDSEILDASESTASIHPSAVVDATAFVDPSAIVGPLCVVASHARVGANTVLNSRVTVGERCVVGDHCIIHSGVVIGADGFGFAPDRSGAELTWVKIEQLGAVKIGSHVEIGANTCIDRGALQDTVIEEGVKLDNLIQVGHNVVIGKHTVVAAATAIAGSTHIGAYCLIGGCVSMAGHLSIAPHTEISGASVVTHSIHKAGKYAGLFPLDDSASWGKNAAALKQLSSLRDRLRLLEKQINKS